MAAPGTVVIAKIIFPETGAVRKEAKVSSDSVGANFSMRSPTVRSRA